jgi:MFS family permease
MAAGMALLSASIVAPILPPYVSGMGASGLLLGVVLAIYSASRAIFMPIFGLMSDRRGRKVFLLIGLGAAALISLAYIPATNVPGLVAVRFFHGIATAMIVPVATAYVGELTPKGREGKWMGRFNTAVLFGIGSGPLVGGVLADYLGMNYAFITMAAMYVIALVGVAAMMREQGGRFRRERPKPSYRKMMGSRMVWALAVFWAVFEISMVAFMTFIPLFNLGGTRIDLTSVGILFAVNVLATSLLQIWTGKTADRFNRLAMVLTGGILAVAPLALIPVSTSTWHLVIIMAVSGAGAAVCMPALSAYQVEEGRNYGMASTGSFVSVATAIGVSLGPVTAGLVNDYISLQAVFYYAAAIGIPGLVAFIVLYRGRSKGSAAP